MSHVNEKKEEPGFGQSGFLQPNENGPTDAQDRRYSTTSVHGRRMSRIGPPRKSSLDITDDTGSGDEYNRLVEMEANDAIKYRTCSWQKVSLQWILETEQASLNVAGSLMTVQLLTRHRLLHCSFRSISAWQSCRFPIRIPSWA